MRHAFSVFAALLSTGTVLAEPLFNGKDLTGWKVAGFVDDGPVSVSNGVIACGAGHPMSGIVYTNTPPSMNYEISLDAMRVEGSDFFIGLTLPVGTNRCTVIIGGWGGSVCGVSCIDYMDASENPYSTGISLRSGKWYHLRVRVEPKVLTVSLDGTEYSAKIPYESTEQFSLRSGYEIEKTAPLGICTFRTTAWWKNIELTAWPPARYP